MIINQLLFSVEILRIFIGINIINNTNAENAASSGQNFQLYTQQ